MLIKIVDSTSVAIFVALYDDKVDGTIVKLEKRS